MMPPMPPPEFMHAKDRYCVPRPQNFKEVPGFVVAVLKNFFSRLIYVFCLVWEARPLMLFVMIFMAGFNGVMPVIGAFISKDLLNAITFVYTGELNSFSPVLRLLIFMFVYLFVNSLAALLYEMLTRISGELVSNHIKNKIMNKAKEIDLADYDRPDFYAMLENANREAGERPIAITRATFNIMSAVISLASFIIVLAAVSPIAPLVIIAVSLPTAIINFVFKHKTVRYMNFHSKERRQMIYYSEILVNKDIVKEIRIFDLSGIFIRLYKEVFARYFAGLKKLIVQENSWKIGSTTIATVANYVLFIIIASGVYEGRFNVGDYALYTGALTTIAAAVSTIITTSATVYEGTLFINNLTNFMDAQPGIVPALSPPRHLKPQMEHRIVFEDVSFHYPGTATDVLHGLNLVIEPRDTVALVGLNGAGKTTFLKLLTRLYDPTGGRILLDGYDLREYDVREIYRLFGIIFQDFGKYAATVSENIAFGDTQQSLDKERVEAAARNGNADSFIRKLSLGYDTPLMRWFEEEGIELSTGQWQKLAISRAFYSDSDILILDEPTASLDPLAEQEVFAQFDKLSSQKITIFVSHRLSSATMANKIVVLENGSIAECGSHSELMSRRGHYFELFSTQAKRYIMAEPPPHPGVGKEPSPRVI